MVEWQIILGVLCAIGFATFALVLTALRRTPRSQPGVVRAVRMLPSMEANDCRHDWEAQDNSFQYSADARCRRCEYGYSGISNCQHRWAYVKGNLSTGELSRCSLCGHSQISVALGDLLPGQSVSMGFNVQQANAPDAAPRTE